MTPFTHDHVETARIEYLRVTSGGLVPRGLVVIAKIPLNIGSKGYSPSKVDALSRAAAAYATKYGLAEITFQSVD